ncbi:MAG TPA: mandelate racemase/muconate lactonizing enzyme family protein [Candidatus Limnocylindrales bacterium]
MRISRVDTIRHAQHQNLVFVQLHTDDGLVGLGETFFGPRTVEAFIHETLVPALFRLDVDPAGAGPDFSGYVGYSSSGAETRANAAVDIALWDLRAQALGEPLHRLLGSGTRTALPVYNTCAGPTYLQVGHSVAPANWGADGAGRYEDLSGFLERPAELAAELLDQGIGAMKIWPFDTAAEASQGQYISGPDLAAAIAPVEAIRASVGNRMDIMVELHGLWNLPMAERIAAALAPYDLRWIEDPVRPQDFAAVGRIAAASSTPIATGETLGGAATHRRLLDSAAISVAIAELAWVGGLTEGRVVAEQAAARDVEVAFHDCTGPVGLTAATHLALASPNATVQEFVRAFYHGWYADLVTALPPIVDGCIEPPPGAGLGIALQPDLATRPGVSMRTSRAS